MCLRDIFVIGSVENVMLKLVRIWYGKKYSRMDQVKFEEDSFLKIWSDMVCLSRPYHFRSSYRCLPQILLGPFLNTLPHMILLNEKSQNTRLWRKMFLHIPQKPHKLTIYTLLLASQKTITTKENVILWL